MFNVELPPWYVVLPVVIILLLVAFYHYRDRLWSKPEETSKTKPGSQRKKSEKGGKLSRKQAVMTVLVYVAIILWGAYFVFRIPNPPYWPALILLVVAVLFWAFPFCDRHYDSVKVTVLTSIAYCVMAIAATLLFVDLQYLILFGTVVFVIPSIFNGSFIRKGGWAVVVGTLFLFLLISGTWYGMSIPVKNPLSTAVIEGIGLVVIAVGIIFIIGEDDKEEVGDLQVLSFFSGYGLTGIFLLFNSTAFGICFCVLFVVLICLWYKCSKNKN